MRHIMQCEKNNHIVIAVVLAVIVCVMCGLTYKAQLEKKMSKPVYVTLMSEHKTTQIVELSEDNPVFSEVIDCSVPNLKTIKIEGKAKKIEQNARITMTLIDADTGEVYSEKKGYVVDWLDGSNKKFVKLTLDDQGRKLHDGRFILTVELDNPGTTHVLFTANQKQGIVVSVNGDSGNKTNIIYAMQYGNGKELLILYVILSVMIVLFVELCYVLIIVKKRAIQHFYVPVALMLGVIMNMVVAIHGVPDEPWHFDTAYKYSNHLLLIKDTEVDGSIYKRQCDVQLQDMLANGVESNSYYQLLHHTFEMPENKELVAVSYTDSSNLVPGIVFLPAAIGISIGRLLGLSTILTLFLGRMMNLLTFVLLTSYAIRLIPVGKNMIGAVGMWPMAMQQGASASYDAIINGMMFVFIALCVRFSVPRIQKWWQTALWIALAVMIAVVKGGVYLPILLLLLLYQGKNQGGETEENCVRQYKNRKWLGIVCMLAFLGLVGLLLRRYLPTIVNLLSQTPSAGVENGTELYSISYVIKHPVQILYLYWNTIWKIGDKHLLGLIGGLLAWHDVEINWLFIITILICTLLLANAERDKYTGTRKEKAIMFVAAGISILLVMLSMVFACTTTDAMRIMGLQGRYYLCLTPLLLLSVSTSVIEVKEEQNCRIWMTMLMMDVLVMLNFVIEVM